MYSIEFFQKCNLRRSSTQVHTLDNQSTRNIPFIAMFKIIDTFVIIEFYVCAKLSRGHDKTHKIIDKLNDKIKKLDKIRLFNKLLSNIVKTFKPFYKRFQLIESNPKYQFSLIYFKVKRLHRCPLF